MNILHINCHPNFKNNNSTTAKLFDYGVSLTKDNHSIKTLNLYDEDNIIPAINSDMLSAWSKQSEDEISILEKVLLDAQGQLLADFLEADMVLIYSPLHNFNVVSKLKDYLDNLLIAGKTFKYTENGSVGLLSNDKKVAYVQSSGSNYSLDLRYVNADISSHYLRTVFDFMGISRLNVIRAEGLDLLGANKEEIIEKAKSNIKNFIEG